MSHPSQMEFFALSINAFPEHFSGDVLDIGSLDINGGPHELIAPRRYVGVDLGEGPNVTVVARGELLDLPSESFDVAMSSECFEHNPHWVPTLHNMIRMTRPGGLVVFSCATTGRAEHGTTRTSTSAAPLAVATGQEYYANVTTAQVRDAVRGSRLSSWFAFQNRHDFDLLFAGLVDGAGSEDHTRLRELQRSAKGRLMHPRYDGKYPRHVLLSLFGDRGGAAYAAAARLAGRG